MKKFLNKIFIVCAIPVILALCLLYSCLLYSCLSESSFDKLRLERESVIEQIRIDELDISEFGIIKLPEEKEYLSDGGMCVLVEYKYKEYGIYFFSVNGIAGDSKGYLYKLDEDDTIPLDKASTRFNFINIESLGNNWYKCKTSD